MRPEKHRRPFTLAVAGTLAAALAAPSAGAATTATTMPAPPSGNPPAGSPPGGSGGGGATSEATALATATGVVTSSTKGKNVTRSSTTITATKADQSAVLAKSGATITLTNVKVVKSSGDTSSADLSSFYGLNAAVLATSGSKVVMTGGAITANAKGANAGFATGTGASASFKNVTMVTNGDGAHGVMATQGDHSTITVKGGSITTTGTGPVFYVTNASGTINLSGVTFNAASKTLLKSTAQERWGTSGSNGGRATLSAVAETLTGDAVTDAISSAKVDLTKGSVWTGAFNAANAASSATLSLDASSTWNVSGTSHLTCLTDAAISGTSVPNVSGTATVTYDKSACPALGGKTFTLKGGGVLKPA